MLIIPSFFFLFSLSFSFSDIVGEWENWLLLHITRYYTLRITLLLNDIYEYNHCKPKKVFFYIRLIHFVRKESKLRQPSGTKILFMNGEQTPGWGFSLPFFYKKGGNPGWDFPPKKGGDLGGVPLNKKRGPQNFGGVPWGKKRGDLGGSPRVGKIKQKKQKSKK